jgi:predicted metal-dependent peptidase
VCVPALFNQRGHRYLISKLLHWHLPQIVQPKLLRNPEFVALHAQTPEKLLMLVMHELHHILLGHTTLFPRMTAEQNFVFDAVINGIV